MKKSFTVTLFILVSTITFLSSNSAAQAEAKPSPAPTPQKPKPDIENGKYGEFAANTFDLWKAQSKKPTPLVVYIHGGGLGSGDKSGISVNQLNEMLEAGLTVMAINYRLTPVAIFPQHYMDSARAIQFARYHAKDFNIDPKRIAATGGSAGGMTSLWIGFHDDMADRKNADPVLRESTRLNVLAISAAQTTLVPDTVAKYVGPPALQYQTYYSGKMFGLTPEEMKTPKAAELWKAISPLTYLSKGDPPVWAYYSVSNKPLTAQSTTSDAIHHPGFGALLKEEMDKMGIECRLRHKEDRQKVNEDMIRFMQKYLK
jgi:acetyl esterase